MAKCDLKCPGIGAFRAPFLCCRWCARARRDFVTEKNKHLWDEKRGFHTDTGCALPRKDMPKECKAYDCKKDMFYLFTMQFMPFVWDGEKWKPLINMRGNFIGKIDHTEEMIETLRNQLERCIIEAKKHG